MVDGRAVGVKIVQQKAAAQLDTRTLIVSKPDAATLELPRNSRVIDKWRSAPQGRHGPVAARNVPELSSMGRLAYQIVSGPYRYYPTLIWRLCGHS